MEESQKRKERLQAMRIEADHNATGEDEGFQLASGSLFNPLDDSSPSAADPQTPRFDFYTNPMAVFSGNKRKGSPHNSGSRSPHGRGSTTNRPRVSPLHLQSPSPTNSTSQQSICQPNFHQGYMHTPRTPFGTPISGYGSAQGSPGSQYYGSPLGFSNASSGSPRAVTPVPRFDQTPNQNNFRQQGQIYSQQQQPSPSPHQQHNEPPSRQYSGSAGRGSPRSDPRRSPWSDSRGSSGCSSGGRGSPWVDARASPSCSPSSGGRGVPWMDSRGTGSPWMNSRGKAGRGLGSSPNYSQGRGGGQGRGWRGHVSAREKPELFYRKSMVEDPWKNLVPVIIDSLRTLKSCDAATRTRDGNLPRGDTPGSSQPGCDSSKKSQVSEISYNFRSGPSLAESLALSLADAVGEGGCD